MHDHDRPTADLVPHRPSPVVFGGLKGEISYDDGALGELDPDVQRMFYGDGHDAA
ncbi:MAG TPA: hypothetical protein VF062_18560 [Candidatus Limnocylindrales bacterium]